MTSQQVMVELNRISKTYSPSNREAVQALKQVQLHVTKGELVAIVGASGSGKSTLLNLLGLLDRPSTGSYLLGGEDVSKLSLDQQARLRNRRIGFVFQAFRLLPRASALENVELPLLYSDRPSKPERAKELLNAVGLGDRLHHRATELSGGQQQRVAIARALVNAPDLLLADEPTGNLDQRSAAEILAILQRLHDDGHTIVLVTHDEGIARTCGRVLRLEGGRIVSDTVLKGSPANAALQA
ncbi:MAG TPA: ABC transporter ATP-binding protein [Polyangiaceae bacterium]|nr:ABC transporter ATP-binding protein [Polyangiaceae bacterium]